MKRGTLLSLCGIYAFGAGCVSGADDAGSVTPMHVHELSLQPGCFTERSGGATYAEMNASFNEMSLEYSLQWAGLYARIILERPTDEAWNVVHAPGPGFTREVLIEAVERRPMQSRFTVTSHTYGQSTVVSGQPYQDVTTVGDGWTDAGASHLLFPTVEYAWSDFAIEALMSVAVPTQQPDGTFGETQIDFYLLRGCDPARGISFQRRSDFMITCWSNSTGAEVSCNGVDLWP